MTKGKAPKEIQERRKQGSRNNGKGKGKGEEAKSRFWKWPYSVLVFISVAGGTLFLRPALSIEVSGSLRASDPVRTVFSLVNNGQLSVYDVTAICSPNIKGNQGHFNIRNINFGFPNFRADVLSPGRRLGLPCAEPIQTGFPTDAATMQISVSYRAKFTFWHQTDTFSFEAERSEDGSWIWKGLPG